MIFRPLRLNRPAWWSALAVLVGLLYSLSASAQAPDAGAKPQPARTFQDWRLQCDAEKKRCFIFQNTNLEKTGQRVLGVVVGNLGPDGKHILHLTVPLGIYIPPGVAIKIDKGKQIDIPVKTCTATGCEVMMDLKPSLLSSLKKGNAANVAFLDAVTRRQITISVSLTGFSKAYTALRKVLNLQ